MVGLLLSAGRGSSGQEGALSPGCGEGESCTAGGESHEAASCDRDILRVLFSTDVYNQSTISD